MPNSHEAAIDLIANEIAELERAQDEIEGRKKSLENTLDALHRIEAHPTALPDGGPTSNGPETGEQKRKQTSPDLTTVAYKVLMEHGSPLHRKDLYDRLMAAGVEIAGQSPISNMTAHMSHDARFESKGSGMWGLVEWPTANPVVQRIARRLEGNAEEAQKAYHHLMGRPGPVYPTED